MQDLNALCHPSQIRIWNMHAQVSSGLARTNDSSEGWHNAFKSCINYSHPNFMKLLNTYTALVKWKTGETSKTSKHSEARNARILKLVDYHNREILQFLKGIAHNFVLIAL